MTTYRQTAAFIMVPCRCGRVLRAKWDQVGTEIVCWDCKASTTVEVPRDRLRVFNHLSRVIVETLRQQGSEQIIIASALLTLALLVPYVGLVLAFGLMVCGAAVYGDMILADDDLGERFETNWTRVRRRLTPKRLVTCVLFVAGTMLPLWVINAGSHRSPHLNLISLPILCLGWTLLPILMAQVYSEPSAAGHGLLRGRLRFLTAHPIAAIVLLGCVPGAMIVCEILISAMFYFKDLLPTFALDFMPTPGKPQLFSGILFYNMVRYDELPASTFIRGYYSGLSHGYSFVGALPPSMSLDTRLGMNPAIAHVSLATYYMARASLVFMISLFLVLSLTLQARGLGVLSNAQRHRGG